MQREVPQELNTLAAKFARSNGVTTLLDMGGKDEPLDEELIRNLDIISPNQTELERLPCRDIADL
jgi:sugar/nucleoside kinase (ribokinase family)